jgi:glycosyltransferase involved in cell wall biosynthesis
VAAAAETFESGPVTSSLRVLLVLGTSTGGIGQHVRSLARGLADRGHSVVVAGPAATDEVFGFSALGLRFVDTPIRTTPGPRDLLTARALSRWVSGAGVVHAHGFRAASLALSAGAGAAWPIAGVASRDVPLVVTWHNQVLADGLRGTLMRRAEQAVARGATLNLGASQDLVRQAERDGGLAELGPVAAPGPRPSEVGRAAMRAELGLAEQPMVLAVGRLHPQKDYPTMLSAMARLSGRSPRPVLVVAGDGPEQDDVFRLAAELGVDVRLLGRRDDVPDLMAAADLLAISSVWEARALVVQEALQQGLPVVATAVGGIPELVEDAAVLVAPGDPEQLGVAIGSLLDDPKRARALAVRGLDVAATWPDEDDVVTRVLEAYAQVGAGT